MTIQQTCVRLNTAYIIINIPRISEIFYFFDRSLLYAIMLFCIIIYYCGRISTTCNEQAYIIMLYNIKKYNIKPAGLLYYYTVILKPSKRFFFVKQVYIASNKIPIYIVWMITLQIISPAKQRTPMFGSLSTFVESNNNLYEHIERINNEKSLEKKTYINNTSR